jgi:hypothetical protein
MRRSGRDRSATALVLVGLVGFVAAVYVVDLHDQVSVVGG